MSEEESRGGRARLKERWGVRERRERERERERERDGGEGAVTGEDVAEKTQADKEGGGGGGGGEVVVCEIR